LIDVAIINQVFFRPEDVNFILVVFVPSMNVRDLGGVSGRRGLTTERVGVTMVGGTGD
jgi:hypothetical protein